VNQSLLKKEAVTRETMLFALAEHINSQEIFTSTEPPAGVNFNCGRLYEFNH